ncbi:hypothetical protein JXQ70_03710 [bacterium]|nr:hypothetical protein [bacterium]
MRRTYVLGLICIFMFSLMVCQGFALTNRQNDVLRAEPASEQGGMAIGTKGSVHVGDTAPDFTNPIVPSPQTFTLYDYSGYVIMLNFWTNT